MAILSKVVSAGLSFNAWIKTLSTARQDEFKVAAEANSVLFADFVESGDIKNSNVGVVFSDEISSEAYFSIKNDPIWLAFWEEWVSIYGIPTFDSETVLLQESTVDKWIPNVESGIGNVKVLANVTFVTTTDGTVIGQIT